MKRIFSTFLGVFCILSIFGQEYNVSNGIVLSKQNQNSSLTVVFRNETELKSAWDNGNVTRYSNEPNNETKLGKFIEIEYDMGYIFEGNFISQGKMKIIFSNLLEINVSEKTPILRGTLLGKTKKEAGNDLRVFIISETDDLQFLKMWTNNSKTEIGGYWYWNPAFLFK